MRRPDFRADGVGPAAGPGDAARGAGPAGPVLEAALDEGDADEHHRGAGDERGEDAPQDRRFGEGEADLEQGAQAGGSQEGAVPLGAGQLAPVRGRGAEPRRVHLRKGPRGDGDDGEARPDDGDQPGPDVVG